MGYRNNDAVTVEDREMVILQFLKEYDLVLPQRPLYINLKRKKHITFTEKTLKRRLDSLVSKGYLHEEDIGNGYYGITDEGIDYLAGNLEVDAHD